MPVRIREIGATDQTTTISIVATHFDELTEVYNASLHDHVDVAAERIMSWSASRLLAADAFVRTYWIGFRSLRINDWRNELLEAFDPRRPAVVWVASMGRDGRLRERAVAALANDPSEVADRLLAIRLDDPVSAVRLRAWDAISRRCSADRAARIVPVLVALRGRWRSSDALHSYAEVYLTVSGEPLWVRARASADRDVRRWAVTEALTSGTVGIAELGEWLRGEQDQWISGTLIDHIARNGDADDQRRLLTMKRPRARAEGLLALGQAAERSEVERGLRDRASQVRASAQWLAAQRGVDVAEFYAQQWNRGGGWWALAGAFETGARFSRDEIGQLCCHEDSRVRNLALRRLGPDLADHEVQWLLGLLDDSGSASTATKVLARGYGWAYDQVYLRWADADPIQRGRLWRLLASRGGWDRVRADLLALTADELEVSGRGLRDLHGWLQYAAANMYRDPTNDQRDDIARDLAKVQLPPHLREAIEVRLHRG